MANSTPYGFIGLDDIWSQRPAEDADVFGRVWTAVMESTREHTEFMNTRMSSLVMPTTAYKDRFMIPGTGELQPIDQNGSPLPVLEKGYFDTAYPLERGGTAWGTNRETRVLMTTEDWSRETMNALRRDVSWMRRRILTALFANTGWTYSDERHGDLSVRGLLAADVNIPVQGGTTATPQHYSAQANAIGNANNPFPGLREKLEAPLGNVGPIVMYIPTALRATTEALDDFKRIQDPNIIPGGNTDVVVAPDSVRGAGDEIIGYCNECYIVLWRALPAEYIVGHDLGAEQPVAMRQYAEPGLQGLVVEQDAGDGNLQQTKLIRIAGFGVRNRQAAVVHRVGNGTYAIPTGYAAPLGG